jgi:hypothetical protein
LEIVEAKTYKYSESVFDIVVAAPKTRKQCLDLHNIFLKMQWERICIYFPKASTFPHLQNVFQKITMKIDFMETCLNFQLFAKGIMGL